MTSLESSAPDPGSESLGFLRKCEDRNHHWWPKADAVAVDIYDNGEVVVLVRVGEKDITLECGGGSPNYAVHVDCKPGTEIDAATQAAMDKMAGLLRKKELIRTGNAGVNKAGQIVDIRECSDAVALPPHNGKDHSSRKDDNEKHK